MIHRSLTVAAPLKPLISRGIMQFMAKKTPAERVDRETRVTVHQWQTRQIRTGLREAEAGKFVSARKIKNRLDRLQHQ